jgi:hypothetical protein
MASRQLNLRFDEQHHDVVRQVVDRLRRDSSFPGALEALLGSGNDPAGDQHALDTLETLARLARIEQRLAALETARPAPRARPARPSADTTSSTNTVQEHFREAGVMRGDGLWA